MRGLVSIRSKRRKGKIWVFGLLILFLLAGCIGGGDSSTYSITGKVIDSDGNGIAQMLVTAGTKSKLTDTEGNFAFAGLKGTVVVTVDTQSVVDPSEIVVNKTTSNCIFTIYSQPIGNEVEALHFATISGHGTYFDFDSGEMTDDFNDADIILSAFSIVNGDYLTNLDEYSGNYFTRPDDSNQWQLPFSVFQQLTEEDWQEEAPPSQTDFFSPGDTILLKTTEDKFVKMVIIEIRKNQDAEDAPAIDFVYAYDHEIDVQPPSIVSISLEVENGTIYTENNTDSEILFQTNSEPKELRFAFNEPVYPHRHLQYYVEDDPYVSNEVHFSTPLGWTQQPAAEELVAPISWGGHDKFTIEEGSNFSGMLIDEGYIFSDVSGNVIYELPFGEITIEVNIEN